MPERGEERTPPPDLSGRHAPSERDDSSGMEWIAVALSLLWSVAVAGLILIVAPRQPAGLSHVADLVMIALSVVLPVAMIWMVARATRITRGLHEENRRLQRAVDALRSVFQEMQERPAPAADPVPGEKPDASVVTGRTTATALTMFHSSRRFDAAPGPPAAAPAPAPDAAESEQATLPLGTHAEENQPPVSRADFIWALNFPETADDRDGFAALRRALRDRSTAQLIQAAQDVLTLLSQDGIYMDDLRPDHARPEIWRRFADGARGREVAALGGVHDRASLALTAARMKRDAIFRDAAHHFLRLFDRTFTRFAETASDSEISRIADTRTGRAFMLLGRVAGTFD